MARLLSPFVALLSLAAASAASAAVRIEFIDTGTPTDGTRLMTGWHGVIVRAVSDGGPITRVDLGSDQGLAGLGGVVAQRWLDPTGQGNFSAGNPTLVRTPGFTDAKNTSPSVENFDSHLLGDASHFVVTSLPGENNAYFSPTLNGFYQRTGIPSDGFVGYGASTPFPTLDYLGWGNGRLWGAYDVLGPYQSRSLDVAYFVTDSGFSVSAYINADRQIFPVNHVFIVPEPLLGTLWIGCTCFVCQRSRKRRGVPRSVYARFVTCRAVARHEPRVRGSWHPAPGLQISTARANFVRCTRQIKAPAELHLANRGANLEHCFESG